MDENADELTGKGRPAANVGEVVPPAVENSSERRSREIDRVPGALTGTTIGQYLVEERLGGGAMAAVFRAHDQILDQRVAIKVLLPGADAVMQARFRREARLVSTLVHPHIVRTLQVGRSGGVIYIAMELVEGASLAELLERHGKLSVGDAARILAPVAEALAYAHEKGIVHRDVKPSNILFQRALPGAPNSIELGPVPFPVVPLLSDFGIARALDAPELTSAGRTIGTPAFMAPEQCAGSAEIDGRADVYALGAVLYRCLVGRPPFSGSTTQILHAHVYDPLLIPDAVADALPAPMVQIMAKAMMKEPAQRFGRVEQLAAALQQVAALPEAATGDALGEVIDPTMTMASLPVAKAPTSNSSRVLVAAAPVVAPPVPRANPLSPVPRAMPVATTLSRVIPVEPPLASRTRLRRGRGGMIALVSALIVLMILFVGMMINSFLPGIGVNDTDANSVTPTAAVVGSLTPEVSAVLPEVPPVGTALVETPERDGEVSGPEVRPTLVATPTVDGTPTPIPPPAASLPYHWSLAQGFFEDGEWGEARDALNLVSRILAADEPLPLLVIEGEIDPVRVEQMLVISHVGLAANAGSAARWGAAIGHLEDAIEIAPTNLALLEMREDFTELEAIEASNDSAAQEQRRTLLADVAAGFVRFADQLGRENLVCDAAVQVENAIRFAASEALQNRQEALATECTNLNAEEGLLTIGGTILYSTGGSGTPYTIWGMPIRGDTLGTLQSYVVVGNGTQPQLAPNGTAFAYYSRESGQDGLWIARLSGLSVTGSERIGSNAEDSRYAPPSWDSTGTQIAYSSGPDAGWASIYVGPARAGVTHNNLGFGKDPAWRPGDDLLVFNGPDNERQNPGLRFMRASGDGRDRYALIDTNGNDQRPTWSPDGRYVVFMSQDRLNIANMEVYRLEFATGELMRLTDGSDSQDGLPTVSPDGKWVVFMSDRGGTWRLWYVSIDGGPVQLLSEISGQPISWLEHSVQWIR